MASWTSLGHAMRRRMGAPSSHHESAGTAMARNIMTPEEVIASAQHANSARRYVGMDMAKSVEAVAPEKGTLKPKGNKQASDPTIANKANRKNVLATPAERSSARFRVSASYGTVAPEAAPTMANAKVIRSVAGRQAPNFGDGMNSVR